MASKNDNQMNNVSGCYGCIEGLNKPILHTYKNNNCWAYVSSNVYECYGCIEGLNNPISHTCIEDRLKKHILRRYYKTSLSSVASPRSIMKKIASPRSIKKVSWADMCEDDSYFEY
jgi:hypothetical protein